VGKPTTNINNFLEIAKTKILRKSILAGLCVVLLSTALIIFIVRPIKLLTRYAEDVRQGKKATLPKLGRSEIGDMGRAFEKMRDALEGKKYVEHYIQTLTHEIKSPISAIQGAAELLEEDMSQAQRTRFLTNIRNESDRIRQIVERMLHLSSLESMNDLEEPERVEFHRLVEAVLERFNPVIVQNNLQISAPAAEGVHLTGDAFLIKQAISNLIQNAIDFSPAYGQISILIRQENERLAFVVEDQGPGIPDFARDRVFQKFFSIQRPVSGEKSTGLGLNFVRKIAELHNGAIRLDNRSPHGVRAILSLPLV
jgi:two-component system sensor histidine kinase CreC